MNVKKYVLLIFLLAALLLWRYNKIECILMTENWFLQKKKDNEKFFKKY